MADELKWLDDVHPSYPAAAKKRRVVRDAHGGAETLRVDRYLPQFEAETHRDWEARMRLTFPEDAVAQTLAALTGLALRKEPELGEDVDAILRADWERLDGEGRHASVVAADILDAALLDGQVGVLTDAPADSASLTLAEERARGVRPYVVLYLADQIVDWDVEVVRGRRMLTYLKLKSEVARRTGDTTRETFTEYRVFWLRDTSVEYAVYEEREVEGRKVRTEVSRGPLVGPAEIPLGVVYGGNATDILQADPPMLGLAYTNIRHTQVESDRAYSMHLSCLEIPVFTGMADPEGKDDVVFSASRPIKLGVGADFKFVGPSGTALPETREERAALERRMARQGLALLDRDTRETTATSSRINAARDTSKLARAARSLQDGLETVLAFFAAYRGLSVNVAGSVKVNRDFTGIGLPTDTLRLLREMEREGQLTLETLLRVMQGEGALPEDLDPVEEAAAVARGTEDVPMVPPQEPMQEAA